MCHLRWGSGVDFSRGGVQEGPWKAPQEKRTTSPTRASRRRELAAPSLWRWRRMVSRTPVVAAGATPRVSQCGRPYRQQRSNDG